MASQDQTHDLVPVKQGNWQTELSDGHRWVLIASKLSSLSYSAIEAENEQWQFVHKIGLVWLKF